MAEPQPVDVEKLDADIAEAWAEVKACRQMWARSPNADSILAHELAEAQLNRLLEFRHAAKPWLSREQTMPSGQAMAG